MQFRLFNFREPTGRKLGWKPSVTAGTEIDTLFPQNFVRLNMAPGQCNICAAPLGQPVYRSANNASITTMNKVIPGRTEVFFCGACGHLQTTELPNLDAYYATEYEINFASEDDDQLYKVIDGRPVYRAEHQANVLLRKLHFGAGHRVLDYGCAKAATLRKVATAHTDIVPYAFDVTDKYVPAWQRFIAAGTLGHPPGACRVGRDYRHRAVVLRARTRA